MTEITPARRRNAAGLASLVAGVLLLLWSLIASSLTAVLPLLMQSAQLSYATASTLMMIPGVLLALLALVLGIVGLLLRDRPRVAAIIGTTVGTFHLVATVGGLLASLVVGAQFS